MIGGMTMKKRMLVVSMLLLVILLCGMIVTSCGKQAEVAKNNQALVSSEKKKETKETEENKVEEVEDETNKTDSKDEETKETKSTTKGTTSSSSSKKTSSNSTSSKKENSSSSSSNSSSSSTSKNETSKNEDKKEESSSSSNSSSSSSSNKDEEKKEESSSNNKQEEEKHSHSWKPVYKEVDKGYWKQELVKAAWTEEVPTYTMVWVTRCNGCGIVLSSNEEIDSHFQSQLLLGNYACGGYTSRQEKQQNGTKLVEHPAEYKDVWVSNIVKEVDYYKCSCGQTK